MKFLEWKKPPRIARWLLERIVHKSTTYAAMGDFEEEFEKYRRGKGYLMALIWYCFQILLVIPEYISNHFYWSIVMFGSYIKMAIRNVQKYKVYAFINIICLSFGMACSVLILLWIQNEWSTDKFHEKIDNIFIIGTEGTSKNGRWRSNGSPPAIGPALKEEYPEVVSTIRYHNGGPNVIAEYGGKIFKERLQAADPSIFEVFTFPLMEGDPGTALEQPNSVVLSESAAKKYFEDEYPIGKIIRFDDKFDFIVTGVMKNVPGNSRRKFNFLISMEFLRKFFRQDYIDTWYNLSFNTYALLKEGTSYEEFTKKVANRIRAGRNEDVETYVFAYPYKDLYIFGNGSSPGRIEQINTFLFIAFIILLFPCINFMNLSTAIAGKRSKEIGMRKVVGALKKNLRVQFLTEAIVFSVVALFAAVLIVWLFLPVFNDVSGKSLTFKVFSQLPILLGLLGVTLFTGLVAGIYPAFFISSFRPIVILRGTLRIGSKNSFIRKSLVIFQFAVSLVLIIRTVVVFEQLDYMRHKDVGIKKDQIVYFRLEGPIRDKYLSAKEELSNISGIVSTSAASHAPTGVYTNGTGWGWQGKNPDYDPLVSFMNIDEDFMATFETQMQDGEYFSPGDITTKANPSEKILVNAAFARIMQLQNPVGKQITWTWSTGGKSFVIAGVAKDFNFMTLKRELGPLVIGNDPNYFNYIFMKIKSANVQETLKEIESVFKRFNPLYPFEYAFLDEEFEKLYKGEQKMGTITRYFSGAALIIACLGLFGVAAFMVEQRTKEIAVRKVLGASLTGVTRLLIKDFVTWIVVANMIAWPIAWKLSKDWLDGYAFKIDLNIQLFVFAGILSLLVAISTVIFRSVKAANTQPVDILKYE